jgi:hypothetical protein
MNDLKTEASMPNPELPTVEDNFRQTIADTGPGGINENRIYNAGAIKTLESGKEPTPEEEFAWAVNNILAEDDAHLNPREAAHFFNIVRSISQKKFNGLQSQLEKEYPNFEERHKPGNRLSEEVDALFFQISAIWESADSVGPDRYPTEEKSLDEIIGALGEGEKKSLEEAVEAAKSLISTNPDIKEGVSDLASNNLDRIFSTSKGQ